MYNPNIDYTNSFVHEMISDLYMFGMLMMDQVAIQIDCIDINNHIKQYETRVEKTISN